MTLAELIREAKRRAPIGDINNTTDTLTSDLILSVNNKCWKAWASNNWKFALTKVSETIGGGVANHTFPSDVGRLVALQVTKQQQPLEEISLDEFLKFSNFDPASDNTGIPNQFYRQGFDANENIQIVLVPTSSTAITLNTWYVKKFIEYAVADIVTNTGLTFFPKSMHHVILNGVLADALEIAGKKEEALTKLSLFEKEINDFKAIETENVNEKIKSPPPDYYRNKKRLRKIGMVV